MRVTQKEGGFTLIELLTVVAIVGVLAAVAIPQYALYRQKGFDARAVFDLRNAAEAEEYWYASNETYITCSTAAQCQSKLEGYTQSAGVNLAFTASDNSYIGTASHNNGTRTFTYDSQNGGLQP